jgi:hypothetical protein
MKASKAQKVLDLFATKYADLQQSDVSNGGSWNLSWSDPDASHLPSRDQLIAHLALFRQFFLLSREPVYVKTVIDAARSVVVDDDLLTALDGIEKLSNPFDFSFCLSSDGQKFGPEQLTKEWISKYLHSDQISEALPDHKQPSWGFTIMPLALIFARGSQVLKAITAVLGEAQRRKTINPPINSAQAT